MRANSGFGGFEFMDAPGEGYYRDVPGRIPSLTENQLKQLEVRRTIFAKCECTQFANINFQKSISQLAFFQIVIKCVSCGMGREEGRGGRSWGSSRCSSKMFIGAF